MFIVNYLTLEFCKQCNVWVRYNHDRDISTEPSCILTVIFIKVMYIISALTLPDRLKTKNWNSKLKVKWAPWTM